MTTPPVEPQPDGNRMKVKRVQDENGSSHIEPPLDDAWPDLRKLEWLSGLMLEDYGMHTQVDEALPGQFCIFIPGTVFSVGGQYFRRAWHTLTDLGYGYAAGVKSGRCIPPTCTRCHGWHAALTCSDGGYAAEATP